LFCRTKASSAKRDLCKTPPFAQSRRQSQILILEILNVFLWLKFSPFLALNKIGHFSKVSKLLLVEFWRNSISNEKNQLSTCFIDQSQAKRFDAKEYFIRNRDRASEKNNLPGTILTG